MLNPATIDFTSPDAVLALLERFCAKDDARSVLNTPSRIGDFIYGVNGFIAIRILDKDLLHVKNSGVTDMTNLASLFSGPTDGVDYFKPLPDLPSVLPCNKCRGSGKDYSTECEECDGKGSFNHGSHTYDCKECDGNGRVDHIHAETPRACGFCNGTGHGSLQVVKLGNSGFRLDLLHMIASLPGAMIHYPEFNNTMTRFIFDGGEGVIMPVRT